MTPTTDLHDVVRLLARELVRAGRRGRLPGDAAPAPLSAVAGPGWRFLSDLESDIVVLLLDEGGQTKREIAAALGRPPEGLVGDVLTNLAARMVLISSHEGYRVNASGQDRQRLRDLAQAQVEAQGKKAARAKRPGYRSPSDLPDAEIEGRIKEAEAAKAQGRELSV
jgi:hypothetical protein